MKKLVYQYEDITEVYNPETELVEEAPTLIGVIIENATDEDIAKAKEIAYNGEYTIEDDGQADHFNEPTAEEMLNALLGVTE